MATSSIKSRIILVIMQSRLYKWIVINIIPFIRISFYYSDMRGYKYKRAYQVLEKGDIILCRDKWKLTSLLIPGKYSHAALCVEKDKYIEFEVAEMGHRGFTKSTFYDIFRESTELVILRCEDWNKDYIDKVIKKCKAFENVPYDINFQFNIEALYCSELVYQSDFERRLQASTEDLLGIGRQYISPMGLYKAKNCKVIWNSEIDDKNVTEKALV